MRLFHCAAFAAVAVIGFSSLASAADLPVKAPQKVAPPIVPYTWTGFYIGGNVGGVVEHASGTSDFLDPSKPIVAQQTNPQGNSFSNTGFIGGVQAGYNWQIDPRWVVGVEVDWDWTHTGYSFCRQTTILSVACADNSNGFESISSTTDWIATARGRVGVTVANFLLYGTGGIAWGQINTTLSQSCLVGGCGYSSTPLAASSTSTAYKTGWAAGLGAEYAIGNNWSARAEWLHIDLGTISDSLSSIGNRPLPETTTWSRSERYDQFRVGLNYRYH